MGLGKAASPAAFLAGAHRAGCPLGAAQRGGGLGYKSSELRDYVAAGSGVGARLPQEQGNVMP